MTKLEACEICGSSPLPKHQRRICGSIECEKERVRRNQERYNRKKGHKPRQARAKPKPKKLKLKLKKCPNCREQFHPKRERQIFCNRKCYFENAKLNPRNPKPKILKVPRKILHPITLFCQFCGIEVIIENVYRTKHQGEFTCKDCLEKEKSGKDGDLSELMAKRKAKYLQEKAKWLEKQAKSEREKEGEKS